MGDCVLVVLFVAIVDRPHGDFRGANEITLQSNANFLDQPKSEENIFAQVQGLFRSSLVGPGNLHFVLENCIGTSEISLRPGFICASLW